MRNLFILIFVLFLGVSKAIAQQFPITVIPQITKPSPVYIHNYADDSTINSPIQLRLLLNDITATNEQIRLKIYFEGNGISFQSRDQVIGSTPLFIDGGTPLLLTNVDIAPHFEFQNITGINSNVYGVALPEGNYQFCFEIFGAITNNKLSSKTCVSTYIFNNEPPLLNLPFNNTNIEPNGVENIVFQWTPRHINVSNVEYELSLVEIWDDMVDPRTAFLTSPPFFQTTTRTTTFIYGPGQPLLLTGKRYAWQVRAKALQGIEEVGLFRNEGKSEIFWFSRTEPCKTPNSVYAEAKGKTKVNVFWEEDTSLFSEYTIEYKEANDASAQWFSMTTNSSWATIWHLKPGTTYEFKVQGKCKFQSGNFSEIQEVTTANEEDESANYNCGIVPNIEAVSNRSPHPGLQIGDSVTAGDFIMTITEITSQSNGILSGTGFVKIPYLKYARFAVKFDGILVNIENQLAQGEIVTLYDPFFGEDATMTVNVEVDLKETIKGDEGEKYTAVVDFVITEIITRDNGATVIRGENGEEQSIPGGRDTEIIDSDGKVWSISEDGEVTKGEEAKGGPATTSNTNGISEEGVDEVSDIGVRVDFVDSGFYSYDAVPVAVKDILKEHYPPVTIGDSEYQVPFKAIGVTEGVDFIKAKAVITNKKYTVADVIFKTKDGVKIDASWEASVATLSLKQKFDYQIEDIIATVVSKEDTEKQEVIGAFKLVHLNTLDVNLIIIPLDNARLENGVVESINNIYHKAGVHFNTTVNSSLDLSAINWDLDGDGKLEVGESSMISFYTPEQKVIINYIKSQQIYNPKTHYMLVGDMVVSKSSVDGFMPLSEQFGFVFGTSNQARTIAHELGHGIFGLEHPFKEYKTPEGATDFLMDYGSGTLLNNMDWKKMHAGGLQFNWLQGDDDGASNLADNTTLKNGVLEILAHIKKRYNGEEEEFNWSKFVRSSGGQSKKKSSTKFTGDYAFNLSGQELVFSLKEQPAAPDTIKIIPGEEVLKIEDNNDIDLLKINVIYKLTLDAENGSFLFEFDTHDELEVFCNYLKIGRDKVYVDSNQSAFSIQVIDYLNTNHLGEFGINGNCNDMDLYLKEIPSDYLALSKPKELWVTMKNLLYCLVDDKGVSEEKILIKIIKILGEKEEDFLDKLFSQTSNGKSMFELLYRKIDNWGGEDNFTELINTLYKIWLVPNTDNEAIASIPYKSKKDLGFYSSNYDVSFNNDYKNVSIVENIVRLRGQSRTPQKWDLNVYAPIELVKYDELQEGVEGFEFKKANVPAFILAAIAQKESTHNWDRGGNLAVDAALTFSGVGNIGKLKYIRNLSKLKTKESYALAEGVTTTLGTINFMIQYSDACDESTAYCTKLKQYLTLVEASLSLGSGYAFLFKRKAGELLTEIENGSDNINDAVERKQIVDELTRISGQTSESVLKDLNELFKAGDLASVRIVRINNQDVDLSLTTVSFLLQHNNQCKESELCKEIEAYLGYVQKAIKVRGIADSTFKIAAENLLKKIESDTDAFSNAVKRKEVITDLNKIKTLKETWKANLDPELLKDLNDNPSMEYLFTNATVAQREKHIESWKVLKDYKTLKDKSENIEILSRISDRFEYGGEKSFKGLNKLINEGSDASKKHIIEGLSYVDNTFKGLPVTFSGVKRGKVKVYNASTLDGKGELIAYYDDNVLTPVKTKEAFNKNDFEVVGNYKDQVILRKNDEIWLSKNTEITVVFGRESFNNKEGFIDILDGFLIRENISLEEFHYLMQQPFATLNDAELGIMERLRNAVPMPTTSTILQKVIPGQWIEGNYNVPERTKVDGFITRAVDAKHLKNTQEIFNGLRLDYNDTNFKETDISYGIIRFKTKDVNQIEVPVGASIISYPLTGNSSTSGVKGNLGAYELKVDNPNKIDLEEGAEIWEIFQDGREVLRAKLILENGIKLFKEIK